MVLGTFPTEAGISFHYTNLEMFTYKNVEAWCSVCESLSMCECVWSKETLGSRDSGGERSRGWGRYYQALIFVVMMTSRHTCTLDTHARASLVLWVCLRRLLSFSLSLSLPLALTNTQTHTKTQTHAPKPENYSLACKHWADGLLNDCCVQCKRECAAFPLYVPPYNSLDPKAQVWLSFTFTFS